MPNDLDLDPLFDNSPRARLMRFVRRVINTRYLFIALLIHVVVLMLFGGKIIFDAIQAKGAFESEGEVLVAGTPGPPPPLQVRRRSKNSTSRSTRSPPR